MPSIAEIVTFLEDKDCLRLGESPWDPGDLSAEYEIRQVDWRGLFGRRPTRDGAPWDLYPDPWLGDPDQELIGVIDQVLSPLEGRESPAPIEPHDCWDVCAWYQPIHY